MTKTYHEHLKYRGGAEIGPPVFQNVLALLIGGAFIVGEIPIKKNGTCLKCTENTNHVCGLMCVLIYFYPRRFGYVGVPRRRSGGPVHRKTRGAPEFDRLVGASYAFLQNPLK